MHSRRITRWSSDDDRSEDLKYLCCRVTNPAIIPASDEMTQQKNEVEPAEPTLPDIDDGSESVN